MNMQSSFLMDAMLGLAASHLATKHGSSEANTGLYYRQAAVSGVRAALDRDIAAMTTRESDALLASCYALTVQTSYLSDGMCDFITMLRGCGLVAHAVRQRSDLQSSVFTMDEGSHLNMMELVIHAAACPNMANQQAALVSLEILRPWCRTACQQRFLQSLTNVVEAGCRDLWECYSSFSQLYADITTMSQTEAHQLAGVKDNVSKCLLAHFLAIQLIVTPLTSLEAAERAQWIPLGPLIAWIDRLCGPTASMPGCFDWPRLISQTLENLKTHSWPSLHVVSKAMQTTLTPPLKNVDGDQVLLGTACRSSIPITSTCSTSL